MLNYKNGQILMTPDLRYHTKCTKSKEKRDILDFIKSKINSLSNDTIKYYVLMYKNGKMIPAETILRMEGGDKGE
jgi:hypothetical protein